MNIRNNFRSYVWLNISTSSHIPECMIMIKSTESSLEFRTNIYRRNSNIKDKKIKAQFNWLIREFLLHCWIVLMSWSSVVRNCNSLLMEIVLAVHNRSHMVERSWLNGVRAEKSHIKMVSSCELLTIWKSSIWTRNSLPLWTYFWKKIKQVFNSKGLFNKCIQIWKIKCFQCFSFIEIGLNLSTVCVEENPEKIFEI